MKTRIAFIVLASLLLVSCASREPGDVHADHAAALPAAAAPASDLSLFQLQSHWTDQHGAMRMLGDLRGRPQLIAMVYTNCGWACPRIVSDMKKLEAEFSEVGLVLVSIDPERDTPGRLREFADGLRLGERWTLLNGEDADIMELAAVLGIRYRRVSETDFMHSTVITLLDENGVAVHRQEEIGQIASTRAALQALSAE